MKGTEDEDGLFAYGSTKVPIECYSILLARLQREHVHEDFRFAKVRERLNETVQKFSTKAVVLSTLAVVDALLEKIPDAITEAKRAAEMLPISKDALEGTCIAKNLTVVYAWADELDLAFATLDPLTKAPRKFTYGELKGDRLLDPLRKDPRFDKLLAELAPKD